VRTANEQQQARDYDQQPEQRRPCGALSYRATCYLIPPQRHIPTASDLALKKVLVGLRGAG
jgi:hypothetical protein